MAGTARPPSIRAATHRGPVVAPLVVLAGVVVVPAGLVVTIDGNTYDIWGAFVWGPLLLLAALPLCRWVASRTGEPEVIRFLMGAALLKVVVGGVLRYVSAELFYGGLADAGTYDGAAAELVPQLRAGDLTGLGQLTGTRFIEVLTGLVQAVIGETLLGSFFVFSFFGFVGLLLFYLAFCQALPDGDRRLYRLLLFLTPTMWYWPSSIGKESFLMLCLGAAAYGLSRVLTGHLGGLVIGALGAWGLVVVRPHFVLILLAATGAALVLGDGDRRPTGGGSRLGVRIAAALAILAALPFVLGAAERFFKIDGLNLETVTDVRANVADRTRLGGSEFEAPDTDTPAGFASGLVTVLVRPFPWEAGGTQLFTSLEGLLLVVTGTACIWRRRAGWPRAMWRMWPRFSLAYVLVFAWAFSVVGNFGILARQRSLMYPMLFVVFAATTLPVAADAGRTSRARAGGAVG